MRLKHILLLFLLSFGLGYSQTNEIHYGISGDPAIMIEKSELKLQATSGNIEDLTLYVEKTMKGYYGLADWNEIYEMLTKAHNANSTKATLYLFIMFSRKGSEKSGRNPYYDLKKAYEYLEIAAKRGNDNAMMLIAGLYERGEGSGLKVEKDLFKATAWHINMVFGNESKKILAGKTYERKDVIEQLLTERFATEEDRSKARDMIEEYTRLYPIKKY